MPRFEVVWPKGVGYRTSADLDAKADDRVPAKRGEVVVGEAHDGWVSTEDGLFLPLHAPDGRPLLKRLANFISWQGPCDNTEVPQGVSTGVPGRAPGSDSSMTSELDALHKKYDKKYGRPRGSSEGAAGGTPFGSAATSHDMTTAYMHEFRNGLEEMGIDTNSDAYLNTYAPTPGSAGAMPGVRRSGVTPSCSRPGSRASNSGGSRTSLSANSGRASASPGSRMGTAGSEGPRSSATLARAGGDLAGTSGKPLSICGAMLVTRSAASGAGHKWREGPANAIVPVKEWASVKHGREVRSTCSSGRVIDVSDRNIMCMSVLGEKAVLGSADHGLKEVNVRAGQVLRTLYTKRYGHTEWVSTVSHCPDGRVLSGGMDSKICLWNASGVTCVDLTGHLGSISRIRTHAQRGYAISAAYDRTLRVWDLQTKKEVACCTGHDAPVLDFIWADDVVASGDRGGIVRVWDAFRAQYVVALTGHKGHITAMLALPQSCCGGGSEMPVPGGSGTSVIATGAQDGHIRIWDLRQKLNTFNLAAHPGGAVNDLGVTLGASPPLIVSTGADGRVLVFDPRASFAPLHEFGGITDDFLYSLLVLDDIAFTGDGRGNITCFDLRAGRRCYALAAGENAIRCLGATETSLAAAGDDGNVVVFDF